MLSLVEAYCANVPVFLTFLDIIKVLLEHAVFRQVRGEGLFIRRRVDWVSLFKCVNHLLSIRLGFETEFVVVNLLLNLSGSQIHNLFGSVAFVHLCRAAVKNRVPFDSVFYSLLGRRCKFPAFGCSEGHIMAIWVFDLAPTHGVSEVDGAVLHVDLLKVLIISALVDVGIHFTVDIDINGLKSFVE